MSKYDDLDRFKDIAGDVVSVLKARTNKPSDALIVLACATAYILESEAKRQEDIPNARKHVLELITILSSNEERTA